MSVRARVLVVMLALLAAWPAGAQEPKGWLGVEVRDVSKAEADKLGWDGPRGAIVSRPPASGSPAERAGLKVGDIILAVDRALVDTSSELNAAIEAKRPGSELRLQVLSAGREKRIALVVAEQPAVRVVGAGAVPQLMLDTGGHMAIVRGLAFTPDGRHLVSASDDKVIRVWDWEAGKTVRTIRGEVGAGDEGKIFALALSRDGLWLAAAGWMKVPGEAGHVVRLYDFPTGKLVALLKGHGNAIDSLAFSPDGTRLVSGSKDYAAIIWDTQKHTLVHRLKGHKDDIFAVGFTPDGQRVVTGSHDTTLKLWSARDGKEIATLAGHNDKVYVLAVSPADGSIASGASTGEIRLWDGTTGQFLRSLTNQGTDVGGLSFSPDGKWLLSTCGKGGCPTKPQHVWEVATGREVVTYAKHNNIVLAAAVSPDGRFAATGGGDDRAIHVWDLMTGETRQVMAGTGAPGWAVAFSNDMQRMAWGTTWNGKTLNDRGPLELQLKLPGAGDLLGRPEPVAAAAAKSFVRAHITQAGLALSHRKGGNYGYDAILDISKDGKTQASIERKGYDGYGHWAYSFTPDGQTVVSGGANGWLSAHDLKGQRLGNYVGHEGVVWAVTPSPDGRLLVSGSGDQTIRLWNLKTRELIVTLFHVTGGEWVMWTQQGYYSGSPGADKIVGWQINKGPGQAADYVGAEQLRHHLNRPDIVVRAIVLASAEQAVREAPGTSFKLADLLARPVPRFRIVTPQPGDTVSGGRASITIAVEATPDPVKAIRVQVNGRQVAELTPPIDSGGFSAGGRTLDVPLARGRNDVRITLTNQTGDKAETLTLTHEGEGDLDKRGTLFILAIGVDKYPGLGKSCGTHGNASCDLSYSGADARKLVQAVEERLGPAHTRVVKQVLVNNAADAKDLPTASNILNAIDLLKQARETDTVLLFIAGHGVNDGPNYRFLATNAERLGDAFRSPTVVPWQVLQEAVETAKGRRILFIDTCHSGNAYNQRLGNAAYHANIIAYTAARFDQLANESHKLGHGLFTYAVVEGLEGKGGQGAKRQISTKELADYLVKRVDQLAKELQSEQEPQYYKGRDAEDYVLTRW